MTFTSLAISAVSLAACRCHLHSSSFLPLKRSSHVRRLLNPSLTAPRQAMASSSSHAPLGPWNRVRICRPIQSSRSFPDRRCSFIDGFSVPLRRQERPDRNQSDSSCCLAVTASPRVVPIAMPPAGLSANKVSRTHSRAELPL